MPSPLITIDSAIFIFVGTPSVWISLLGNLIVVGLFVIHRFLDHQNKTREVERNWYMKVMVEPHISAIHTFFDSVIKEFFETCQQINQSTTSIEGQVMSVQVNQFESFQDLKRKFEGSFVLPILLKYQPLGVKLTEILLDLEDRFTFMIDQKRISKDDLADFGQYVLNQKANLLTFIFSPMLKKNKLR